MAIDQRDAEDLRWRFNEAAGDMGARSSFESFVHQCQTGPGNGANTGGDRYEKRHLDAVAKARWVDEVLGRMATEHARTLRDRYTDNRSRPAFRKTFGEGMAPLAEEAAHRRGLKLHDLETAIVDSEHKKAEERAAGAALVASVKAAAQRLFDLAVDDWKANRGKRPRIGDDLKELMRCA